MKLKAIFYFLTLLIYSVQAQDKISIGFIPITYDEYKVESNRAKIIQETIMNAFVATKRFVVVDRDQLEAIEKEKKLQRTEAFMDSKQSYKDGMNKGAAYLVSTNLISSRETEVKGGFNSVTHAQIKLLDVSTGEILVTENISSELSPINQGIKDLKGIILSKADKKVHEFKEDQLNEVKKFEDEAFMISLQRLAENVKRFTSYNFPIALEITNWDKKDKDKFEIAGGYKAGLYQGQRLDIVKVTEVSINEENVLKKIKIGTAYISNVHDENFSEAKVLDDSKEFKEAKKTGATISVLTR